ncbi:hypothetical protein [Leifsonia sp. Le1]|uniref:hypothetical protein n=1 Tax=Leifsonia sp. Le1 TaxID=3404918 RepID=UPI003EBB9087
MIEALGRAVDRVSPVGGQTSVWRITGYALFFLVLATPTLFQPVKILLLLIVLAAIAAGWWRGTAPIIPRRELVVPVVALSAVGAGYVILGIAHGFTAGALSTAQVYVVWPLIFLALTLAITTETHLRGLYRTIIIACISCGIFGCWFIVANIGLLPGKALLDALPLKTIFASTGPGQYSASFPFLSTLLFAVPFLLGMLAWPRGRRAPLHRAFVIVAIVLCVAVILLSGRRALLLAIAVAIILFPVLYLLTASRRPTARFWWTFSGSVLAAIALLLAGAAVAGIDLGAVFGSFLQGFQPGHSQDALIRTEQSRYLWEGWLRWPIFGSGLGGTTAGFVRDAATPWAFELSYNAALYNFGLYGVAVYGIAIVGMIVHSIIVARRNPSVRPYMIPALMGLVCFLVGNATNPYLAKFDSLWVLFLPLAILNVAALRGFRRES